MFRNKFQRNSIYIAVMAALATTYIYADDSASTTLSTIEVKATSDIDRKNTEITGLGKIVKSADDINKTQVMGIRDLTRYDPGISVVEQGRGATSGYSIRGVDRNRVGLQVDGLVQIQSYITEHSRANGGAINEIEYENIRAIEFSKGSASSEFGSGALGGAVSFRTKETADIIKDNKNWGVNSKTAYSSKNRQLANTLSLAGRSNGFEALVQYTHRKGHETQIHKQAVTLPQSFTRVGAYTNDYEIRGGSYNKGGTEELYYYPQTWLALQDECLSLTDCSLKPKVSMTQTNRHDPRTTPAYTAKEQAQYDSMFHTTETVSAKDYTGENRIMPNPMAYSSESWFGKFGYHFNDAHYLGIVLENTTQTYDIQDKSRPSYVLPSEVSKGDSGVTATKGVYFGDNLLSGIALKTAPNLTSLMYSRGYYFDDHHEKNRNGIFYHYTPENGWFNSVNLSYDYQQIDLDTLKRDTHCSSYPHFDKYCRATTEKPLSAYSSERVNYNETHNVYQLNLEKIVEVAKTTHKFSILSGLDRFKSQLNRRDFFAEQARYLNPDPESYDESIFENVRGRIYKLRPMTVVHTEYCKNGFADQDCTARHITGYNQFVSMKDHIIFGEHIDLGLGLRYDKHKFKSHDKFTGSGKYKNWSWNVGLTVRPTENIALSYRRSNGFRVPAFYELYGRRGALDKSNKVSLARQYITKLDPEKANNQEFGIGLYGSFGYLETSYFDNQYRDLVATGKKKLAEGGTSDDGYHNLQNIRLSGVNILGKLDWHSVIDKLPDGLYSTLAYNKIKPKSQSIKAGYTEVYSPILDTLQPARYIVGLGYDAPNENWGLNLIATYSRAKNANELQGTATFGIDRGIVATKTASREWYIYDLMGYYTINRTITLRGGIYNMLNHKYSTWESIRQSSINAVNRTNGNTTRYAAPGRNFSLALEIKI